MYKDDTILVVGQAKAEQGGCDLQPARRVLCEFCGRTGDGKDS